MKKLCFLIVIILSVVSLSIPGQAAAVGEPNFDVAAQAGYLYNLDTDTLIWEKNADQPMYPASITKIMTCILALEKTADLDGETVTYPDAVQDYLYNYQRQNGQVSLGGLLAGEELSMRDMLYAMMLPSANEAAMSVASHIGGSQEGFVQMMNDRARELGAENTQFANPNGLFDPNHTTTARDLFILTRHAISLPGFMDIVTTPTYNSGPTNKHDNLVWNTTNLMMTQNNSYYYPYLQGIKTGTLPEAGRCFVSTASKDGFTYLLVLLGAPYADAQGTVLNGNAAFDETAKLYDWVFSTYKRKSLVEQGKYVKEIPLRLSLDQDHIQLMTASRFTALVPNSIEASSVTKLFDVPEWVDAPVKKGDKIGTMTLILSGEELGKVDLLAGETVAVSPVLVVVDKAKAVLRSFWFKFSVIFLVLLVVLYCMLMISRNKRRRKSGGYKPRRRI